MNNHTVILSSVNYSLDYFYQRANRQVNVTFAHVKNVTIAVVVDRHVYDLTHARSVKIVEKIIWASVRKPITTMHSLRYQTSPERPLINGEPDCS